MLTMQSRAMPWNTIAIIGVAAVNNEANDLGIAAGEADDGAVIGRAGLLRLDRRRRHFLTLLISAGVRSAPGVLIHPLEVDLGWNRAAISFAVSVGLLLFGFAAPSAGS
jgi:hypothetical protein